MGIKRWSDFRKKDSKVEEKMKTFSNKKSGEDEVKEKPQRSHTSASQEYADEVNQNIIKNASHKGNKKNDRKYNTTKVEQTIKDESLYPPKTKDRGVANMEEEEKTNEKKDVEIYGRLAKFPEGVKASKAFNWVYNLKDPKLSKKDIWYIMVEKQDNELQMIKYQQKEGVNLTKFMLDLKNYYLDKYKNNPKIIEKINNMKLGGDAEGNISAITNIPNIKVEEGKKLITKMMEDLVRLLG